MRQQFIAALFTAFVAPAAADDVAPGGTLRAAYIATTPAQATRDATTGATRGPSYDLTVELAKRLGIAIDMKPVAGPAAVIAAVSRGEADIGFIAYEPSRAGTIDFSQTYLLVQQSFIVLDGSSIRTIAEIDRPGQKIAGVRDDSISLYLRRHLKQATLVEIANNPPETKRMLAAKEIDAFGASRPRLSAEVDAFPFHQRFPSALPIRIQVSVELCIPAFAISHWPFVVQEFQANPLKTVVADVPVADRGERLETVAQVHDPYCFHLGGCSFHKDSRPTWTHVLGDCNFLPDYLHGLVQVADAHDFRFVYSRFSTSLRPLPGIYFERGPGSLKVAGRRFRSHKLDSYDSIAIFQWPNPAHCGIDSEGRLGEPVAPHRGRQCYLKA